MSEKNEPDNSRSIALSRRNYLGAFAGTGFLVSSPSIVEGSKESKLDQVYEAALRVRDKRGQGREGQQAFLNHLERRGLGYRNISKTFIAPSNGDVSTTRYFSGDLHVDITIAYDCENSEQVWLDTYWWFEYTCASTGHGGENPDDVVAMYWSSDSYSRIDDTVYTSEYVSVGGTDGDLDPNGVAVEYDDYADWYYGLNYEDCASVSAYFGTKAWIDDPSDPPSSRLVAGDYHHTHTSCSIGGISVGSGGVNITGDCDTESMHITYDQGEEDAVDCWSSGR